MRIKEILCELGNASYDYQLLFQDPDELGYQSVLPDGSTLVVLFLKTPISYKDQTENITIEFSRDKQYKMTATGDQFKLLSTVVKIVTEQLPKLITPTVTEITFDATKSEPSKVSLYRKRFIPILSRLVGPEWKYSEQDLNGEVAFNLKRDKPTQ